MIRGLWLKNFRRYRDEVFSLDEGLNFIEGNNNAGKTTLFYAIEYALFGTTQALRSPSALLHPGEKAMGVELVFVGRDGAEYRLQRVHMFTQSKRSTSAKAKVEGHFTLKRIDRATDTERYVLSSDFEDREETLALKLQEILGLSRRAFELAVHVRQGEIAAILDGEPKLDIVLGVTAAVAANEELRAMALEAEKEASSLPVLESSKERADAERERLAKDLARLGESRETLARERARLEEVDRRIATFTSAQKSFLDATRAAKKGQGALEDARRRLGEEQERLEAKRKKLGTAESIHARRQACGEVLARLEAEAKAGAERVASLREERRKLDEQRGDLKGRIARRKSLPTGEGARCEACGQPIDPVHQRTELEAWKKDLSDLESTLQRLDAAVKEQEDQERERQRARRDQDAERMALLQAEKELVEMEDGIAAAQKLVGNRAAGHEQEVQAALAAAASAHEITAGLLVCDPDPLASLVVRVASADPTTAELEAEVARLETAAREVVLESRLKLEQAKALEKKAENELRERREQGSALERERAGLIAEITRLRKQKALGEKLRTLAQAFKELQVELREKASAQLAADTLAFHRTLSGDESEFSALSIDPSRYAVQVTPQDLGQEVAASSHQGGGHKLLLGLSFRLAIAKMVGPSPFLLLDEPTYGLDATRRKSLLDRVMDLGLARQTLLITHQHVGGAPTRTIRVERKGTGSGQVKEEAS